MIRKMLVLLGLAITAVVLAGCGSGLEPKKVLKNEVEFVSAVNAKTDQKAYQSALDQALQKLSVPEGYKLKDVKEAQQNEDAVWVFRFEKANNENNGLNGEHYSITVAKDQNKILGFTWMDNRFESSKGIPTEQSAKEHARLFLKKVEPGLFDRLENLWIRPHDEFITVNGKQVTVRGMKYKCYLLEADNYAWVIVGANGEIVTFEQEIKWVDGRVTEKWLHDSWLDSEKEQS